MPATQQEQGPDPAQRAAKARLCSFLTWLARSREKWNRVTAEISDTVRDREAERSLCVGGSRPEAPHWSLDRLVWEGQ